MECRWKPRCPRAMDVCATDLSPDVVGRTLGGVQVLDGRTANAGLMKDADLAIYNHYPLSAYAVVQKTLIDGRVYFDRDKEIAGRGALEKEKKDLLAKAKKAAEKNPEEAGEKKGEKKPEEKKPEEKKPEEKPKPPQVEGEQGGAQ